MIYTKDQNYQGILQLRPNNEKVLNYVYDEIERSGHVFITKEINKKFGTDLYLTNKYFIIQLSKRLKNKFHCKITRSRSLYGKTRHSSKLVYRTTMCFRLTKDL